MKSALKRAVINAYCYGLIPASVVVLAFRLIDMRDV